MRWRFDEWRITDAFQREWRLWLAPADERTRATHTSRWDMPGEPFFHLIPQAFSPSGARDDEVARDLLSIYDALTGSRMSEALPRPTADRRRLLRNFAPELSRVLYTALESGTLRYERVEVPWPFPEKDEKPSSRRDGPPAKESTTYQLRLLSELDRPISGLVVLVNADGAQRKIASDGAGVVKWTEAPAGGAIAQIHDVEQLRRAFEGRERTSRRTTPLPEQPDIHIRTMSSATEPIELREDELQTLLLITRTDLTHAGRACEWGKPSCATKGPWLFDSDVKVPLLRVHCDGSSREVAITGAMPPGVARGVEASDPPSPPTWLASSLEAMHDALVRGDLDTALRFLEGLPPLPPDVEEPPADTQAEAQMVGEQLALLESQGYSDPPFGGSSTEERYA
ncbi:hypothetical protein LZC95_49200 [Pendulispora brunnea]|uniref:Uncharacterized protein n=1 Tax=Pendulispora brunnea TaxID=2905690 RepID=A0ABZ2K6U8_9BACT